MTVYLLHFHDRLTGHAGHYLGCCARYRLRTRLNEHAAGRGANLMLFVTQAGITWELARTWPGGFQDERRIKGRKNGSRELREVCPVCNVMPRIDRWAGGGSRIARWVLRDLLTRRDRVTQV